MNARAEAKEKIEAIRRILENIIDDIEEIIDPGGSGIMVPGHPMSEIHNAYIVLDEALANISGVCPECYQRIGHKMDCSKR